MNLRRTLESRLRDAMVRAGAPHDAPAVVVLAARSEFGDYQANGAMAAAKTLKTNPRQFAQQVCEAAEMGGLAEKLEVAGPGFINITLKCDWLAGQIAAMAGDERLGANRASPRQTVVVDYSSPNLAKEMHVGHLRSTIIGDALARTLDFLGHNVIRQNHVGDWGTQFGMLVEFIRPFSVAQSLSIPGLDDLEEFYRSAKAQFDADAAFAKRARQNVVDLQRGDETATGLWQVYLGMSKHHCQHIYRRLGVTLSESDIRGESAYNDELPKVVEQLRKALPDEFKESEGAQCVFLDEFTGKDGEPLPLIVQKSDEGFLYSTTDLAAIRYRVGKLKADRVLYVVDVRQSLHFRQVFAVARKAGFAPEGVSLEHVAFGTMMGPDGRPFKTREGGTVKLADLLDEAERRAFDLVSGKSPDLPEEQRRKVASAVGIGAVKYADLAQNRTSDYVFSFDRMLSLDGNTAPYMQYAYARIRSIFRKGGTGFQPVAREHGETGPPIALAEPEERALAVRLLQFPETVEVVAADCLPNVLCAYLYELAGAFMGFYETCPVLQAAPPVRASRLELCRLTAGVVRQGLALLGIDTVEQM
ncbi:MAG TPA: arginine--tRNA ligase [Phycisphaerae bacterium]|nr:arginine--tRNA ligase [Phycisphaerae bacterium]